MRSACFEKVIKNLTDKAKRRERIDRPWLEQNVTACPESEKAIHALVVFYEEIGPVEWAKRWGNSGSLRGWLVEFIAVCVVSLIVALISLSRLISLEVKWFLVLVIALVSIYYLVKISLRYRLPNALWMLGCTLLLSNNLTLKLAVELTPIEVAKKLNAFLGNEIDYRVQIVQIIAGSAFVLLSVYLFWKIRSQES